MFALVRGNDFGWGSATTVGLLVGRSRPHGGLLRQRAVHARPDARPRPVQDPGLRGALGRWPSALAASIFAMFLYLTLYIQDDLGYGPLAAGVRFLPMTLLAFFAAFFAGRLTVRVQSRLLLGHRACSSSPVGCCSWGRPTRIRPGRCCCPVSSCAGFGIGIVNPVLASGAVSVVQPQRSGMASGANNTFRQVGIATGIAVLGAVFQSQIVAHTTAALNKIALRRTRCCGGAVRSSKGAMASGEVPRCRRRIPVDGSPRGAPRRLPGGILQHLEPPDVHRGGGRPRGRGVWIRPRAPARLRGPDRGSQRTACPGWSRPVGHGGGARRRRPRRACVSPSPSRGDSSGWNR